MLRLCCGILFVSGSTYALFGEDGLADRLRLTREHQRLEAEVAARETRIRRLLRVQQGLRIDPMRRERIAREQLGYVRPGEVVFLLPDLPEPSGD